MAVYFIQDVESGRIKIGYATDPWVRFSSVQCHSPGELKLLAIEPGFAEREAELHATFADSRIRGEWFTATAELLAHIKAHGEPQPARRSKARSFWSGLTDAELASLVGVSTCQVNRIRNGKALPSLPLAIKLHELTGVPYADMAKAAA